MRLVPPLILILLAISSCSPKCPLVANGDVCDVQASNETRCELQKLYPSFSDVTKIWIHQQEVQERILRVKCGGKEKLDPPKCSSSPPYSYNILPDLP